MKLVFNAVDNGDNESEGRCNAHIEFLAGVPILLPPALIPLPLLAADVEE